MFTIQTTDGMYVAPGPIENLPESLRKDGVIGCLIKSDIRYSWKYSDGVISTLEDQAWDTYIDDVNYIVLWHQINRGKTQKFKLYSNGITFGTKRLEIKDIGRVVEGPVEDLIITDSLEIRFVTYNMLVAYHPFEDELKRLPIEHRRWDHPSGIRKNLLRSAIVGQGLMVLVEVAPFMLEYVVPKTHNVLYCPKYKDYGGSAIVYEKIRFEEILRSCEPIIPETTQVLTNILLLDKTTGKHICVTALHLKSGYEDQELRRLREIKMSIEMTEKWLSESLNVNLRDIAHVVAGDLNSDRLAYRSLVQDWMIGHGYQDILFGYKGDNFWTYNYWHRSIFDYIFLKGPVAASNIYIPVSGTKSPNNEQGSDHLPVYCNLTLVD